MLTTKTTNAVPESHLRHRVDALTGCHGPAGRSPIPIKNQVKHVEDYR